MKIEKNVPIPERRVTNKTLPLSYLDIGDSFLIPAERKEISAIRNKFNSASKYWNQKTGKSFVSRSVDGGLRVWRTS